MAALFVAGLAGISATPAEGLQGLPTTRSESAQQRGGSQGAPLVIGHRGASGYRPEHTLASYRLAIQLGADYIEPDLVSTKDGVLVARHENEISGTTDVADQPEFAGRVTTKLIDNRSVTGWFTEDFTLTELKTLRVRERLPGVRPGNTRYDGYFDIPTFEEVLDLVERESRRRGEVVGVYPETKYPTYFDSIGLALEEPLLAALRRHHLDRPNARVFIQSFETTNLKKLSRQTRVPLIQLVAATGSPYDLVRAGDPRTYSDLVTARGLRAVARYADGVGPDKDLVIPRDAAGFLLEPTDLVDDAHAAGLVVHAFTMRDENQYLPADFREGTEPNAKGGSFGEDAAFFDAGVDGVFTDFPDTGVVARELWLSNRTAAVG